MMIEQITREEELLDEEIRAAIIEEIESAENRGRKRESLRRHELFRRKSKKWLIESLYKEKLEDATVKLMINRASNIGILRKITGKIAKCYNNGVIRTVGEKMEEGQTSVEQASLDSLADEIDFNTKMDKADKYSYFDNQCLIAPLPHLCSYDEEGRPKFTLKLKAFPAYGYDVIVNPMDPTEPLAIILSTFNSGHSISARALGPGETGRERNSSEWVASQPSTDGKVGMIADQDEEDKDKKRYIWWTNKYHFTTDGKGKRVQMSDSPEEGMNPIGILPHVNIAPDQEETFWVDGGEDLPDGDLLINKLVTDMNAIAYVQGWGQLVITGKDIPNTIKGGYSQVIVLPQERNDDPKPDVFYAQADPNTDNWLKMIEQEVALFLSSRNLSPRNVSVKLDVTNVASGIALIIEMSESYDDIAPRQKYMQDREPLIWERVKRWHGLYHSRGLLSETLMAIRPMNKTDVNLKFNPPQAPKTEKEHLDAIEQRQRIGLNTRKELLQIDNPDLTDEEAQKKLDELDKEAEARMPEMLKDGEDNEDDMPEVDEEDDDNQNPFGND